MKAFTILCVLVLAAVALAPAISSAHPKVHHRHCSNDFFREGDINVNLEDGSIIYTNEDNDQTVEITGDYELIVNGSDVHLRADQQRLVREYYDCFEGILGEAKEIAKEGIIVGARSAAIGITAAIEALARLGDDCDTDRAERRLERKLDRDGEKIEAVAAKLEKKAERLERRVKKLEKLHKQLRREISDLDDLGWF